MTCIMYITIQLGTMGHTLSNLKLYEHDQINNKYCILNWYNYCIRNIQDQPLCFATIIIYSNGTRVNRICLVHF